MDKQNGYEIPRTIHYVWLGGKRKSNEVKKCILSWRKYCPDYKIVEWNENNYNFRKNQYILEAYKAKKWAFVSDYARYDILYHYGGIYLDTDVELVSKLDPLLYNQMFIGFLEDKRVASGLGLGSVAGNPIIKEILQYYDRRSFYKKNGDMDLRICNHNETNVLIRHGLKRNGKEQYLDCVHVYPRDYLNPEQGIPSINTIAIHHFNGSWTSVLHRTRRKKNGFFLRKFSQKNAIRIIHITDRLWDVLERIEKIKIRKLLVEFGRRKHD